MKKIILAVVITVIIFSCHKKDDEPAPEPAQTTTTTSGSTTGNTTGGTTTGGVPSTATSVNAILTISDATVLASFIPTTTLGMRSGRAYFSASPQAAPINTAGIKVNHVSLNGDSLTFQSSVNSYYTNTIVTTNSTNWAITGANGIPSFTFSPNVPSPQTSNMNVFPDSISKTKNYTFTLNVTSNMTTGTFFLSDQSGNLSGFAFNSLKIGSNVITLTPAQMSGVQVTENGIIAFMTENSQTFKLSGKDVRFVSEKQMIKYIKITN
jgi:hypothetical protein